MVFEVDYKPSAYRVSDSEEAGNAEVPATQGGVEARAFYLHPGQIFVSSEPAVVTTILGSCVATCLWDDVLNIGGVNHYLLPYGDGEGPSGARFANVALERLLEKLLELGGQTRNLKAKVFGGASVMKAFRESNTDLGAKNVHAARGFLTAEGIALVAEDVGGRVGRKLVFHTHDGAAWVRKL